MWIYPARLGILIPGDLQPIAPCPPPLLGRQAVIYIVRSWSPGSDYRGFRFCPTLAPTVGSTIELLVGCSGG